MISYSFWCPGSAPWSKIAEYPLASRQTETETSSLISNGIFALKRKSKTVNGTKVNENKVDSMAELNMTMMIEKMMIHDDERSTSSSMLRIEFFSFWVFVRSLWWWLKRFSELSLQIDTVYYPSIKVITCKCVTIFINNFCYGTTYININSTHIEREREPIACNIGWVRKTTDEKNRFCNSWKIHVIFCCLGISPLLCSVYQMHSFADIRIFWSRVQTSWSK